MCGDQVMTSTDIVVVTRNKDITRYSEPRVTWDQGAIVCRKYGGKIGGLSRNAEGTGESNIIQLSAKKVFINPLSFYFIAK